MPLVYSSSFITTVHRLNTGELIAHSHLLATDLEAAASLRAATATFAVSEARWDILRSPGGGANGGRYVSELKGVEAYLGAGPALRAATRDDGELPRRLLAECVKGIIQSETYLYQDRGFADSAAYETNWKKKYTGSCRLYSNRDYNGRSWYEHVADRAWSDNLFIRSKTVAVRADGEGLALSGTFSDAFHELGVSLSLADGEITVADGNFLRAPDPVCEQTPAVLSALVGRQLPDLAKEGCGRQVGGAQGCAHLADLIDFLLAAAGAALVKGR
jgi:hypothetical protein